MTTTNLRLPRRRWRWRDLPTPLAALICCLAIVGASGLVSLGQRIAAWRDAPTAMPTPALSRIVIFATVAPTPPAPTPPPATPDERVLAELAALREQVAQLQAAQQAQPAQQVVYVPQPAAAPVVEQAPAPVEQAAPTPAEPSTTASAPPTPAPLAPQQLVLLDRNAWAAQAQQHAAQP